MRRSRTLHTRSTRFSLGLPLAAEKLEQRILLSSIPILHSYPQASHTILLDFDGHVADGTPWNLDFETIHAPPFDIDGTRYEDGIPTFSEEEQSRIISIWERVAEDYRPFDVNVTTEDPSIDEPNIFDVGGRAQRVVISSKFDSGIGGTERDGSYQRPTERRPNLGSMVGTRPPGSFPRTGSPARL